VSTPIAIRVQSNIVAVRERQLLNYLCARLPDWVTPDGLTIFGVVGAFTVFAGYAGSRYDPGFLWLATLGFIIHWFGDSLDGSLARHRRIERPKYGYFLDHSVDAFCNFFIMAGLGLTLYVRMDVALFVLIGYFMLCMYVFLNNHVTGMFQLSFLALGPTELRIGLIGINTWMFTQGNIGAAIGGEFVSVYDVALTAVGIGFVLVFTYRMLGTIAVLRREATQRETLAQFKQRQS
jgi:archaetidylinositol phosphate synthase